MCRVLEVNLSGYYKWLNKEKENRDPHQELDQQITKSFGKSQCNYGSPPVAQELATGRVKVSKSTVAQRGMEVLEIKAERKRKHVRTTDSRRDQLIASNILDRDFSGPKPAQNRLGTSLTSEFEGNGIISVLLLTWPIL